MVVVLEIELLGVKTFHLHRRLVASLASDRYISSSLIALSRLDFSVGIQLKNLFLIKCEKNGAVHVT